jgi:hypothetical protein
MLAGRARANGETQTLEKQGESKLFGKKATFVDARRLLRERKAS